MTLVGWSLAVVVMVVVAQWLHSVPLSRISSRAPVSANRIEFAHAVVCQTSHTPIKAPRTQRYESRGPAEHWLSDAQDAIPLPADGIAVFSTRAR